MPARQCSKVDLPDPLGPMTATISPDPTRSEAPRSAGVSPKDLTRFRASMSFTVALVPAAWPALAGWMPPLIARPPA